LEFSPNPIIQSYLKVTQSAHEQLNGSTLSQRDSANWQVLLWEKNYGSTEGIAIIIINIIINRLCYSAQMSAGSVTKGEKAKCVFHCFWQPQPDKNNRYYFGQNKQNRNGRKKEVKVAGKLEQVCEDVKSGVVTSSQPADKLPSAFPAVSFSCLHHMQDFRRAGKQAPRARLLNRINPASSQGRAGRGSAG